MLGVQVAVVVLDRRSVGSALVDSDLRRRSALLDGLAQKARSGSAVALRGQQEVHRVTCLVDGSIQILPLAFDADLGLIQTPADSNKSLALPECHLE